MRESTVREDGVMTGGSRQALAVIAVAGAGLAVAACGSGPAPAPKAAGSVPSAQTVRFCRSAASFMKSIPSAPAQGKVSMSEARANLTLVLHATVKGFTGLESEAPATLRPSLTKIVSTYQAEEQIVRSSGSMGQISQAVVKKNLSAAADFSRVLKYIAVSCKNVH
jgi:hypothetical protein